MLLPCPFCGSDPEWISHRMDFGTGASGMEPPMLSLGCRSIMCKVHPQTERRDTMEWEQGKGYFQVNYDAELIDIWNTRSK